MLGLGQPDMDGRRGSIGAFIQWINTPFVCLLDWVTKRNIMSSDNLLVGSIACLIYWAFVGAIVSLGIYCLACLISTFFHHHKTTNSGA